MKTHIELIEPIEQRTMLMLLLAALCALLFLPNPAHAQCSKPGFMTGDMSLRPRSASCVPFSVTAATLGITSKDPSWVFEYNGLDESKLTTNASYIYTKPGVYRILQISTVDGKPARTCASVYVYDTLPPVTQLVSCGTSVTLTVEAPPPSVAGLDNYYEYLINWGDGGPVQTVLAENAKAIVHTYASLTTYRIQVDGRYRVTRCGGKTFRTFTPGSPPRSPVISRLEANGATIRVVVSNADNALYGLEQQIGSVGYTRIATGTRASSNRFTAPLDTIQTNCFRLVQIDPCFPAANFLPTCYTPPRREPPRPVEPLLNWHLPSAFTPNGDRVNDLFGVIGQTDPTDFQLSILNRGGTVIFRTTDPYQPWDGTVGGNPAPVGVYGYHVRNGRAGGESSQKSGVVTLIR